MSTLGRPPVFPDIVEEHFDELDFLWEHRETNIFTPDWNLEDLAYAEERAEAHLDGLRLAEMHAVELAQERIGAEETFAAAAAALVLWETGERDHTRQIFDVLRSGNRPAVDGIRVALRHVELGQVVPVLEEMTEKSEPFRAAAAADVLAFHRLPVPALQRLLEVEEPDSKVLLLGAAARLEKVFPRPIASAVEAPDPGIRRAGLHAAARLSVTGIIRHCRSAASREVDPDPEAVYFLGVLADPRDLSLLGNLAQRPDTAGAAVAGLGAMGNVDAVPLLLDLISDPELGVIATAAYKRITGAEDVEGERPFPPPEISEGEDEAEALPPDPQKARADWAERAPRMPSGSIWQAGVPVPDDAFPATELRFSLETRRDLYLRLRARGTGGVPDFELEALALRQVAGPSHPGRGS